ncbi:MAG TPA: hypothetical protein VGW77_27900 [Candidatus Binatia bacterium]|nr:hypothetical protein [Candidatus Binatia bacterium]
MNEGLSSGISNPEHRPKLSSNRPTRLFWRTKQFLPNMAHAKSLRVIGQTLEVAKVATFELENDGQFYDVRSDSLTQTGEWILRNALADNFLSQRSGRESKVSRSLRFSATDIARLDAEAQKRRQNHSLSHGQGASKLSQLLRTLGDHLDRTEVSAFHISWTPVSVFVDYHGPGGLSDFRTFTHEKLQQLGLHTRFRRSNRGA